MHQTKHDGMTTFRRAVGGFCVPSDVITVFFVSASAQRRVARLVAHNGVFLSVRLNVFAGRSLLFRCSRTEVLDNVAQLFAVDRSVYVACQENHPMLV